MSSFLGLGGPAEAGELSAANNLSEVTAVTARKNLGAIAGQTVYVAASNGSTLDKATADYVGDGANDQTIFANAEADSRIASGGVIQLGHGTFVVGAFWRPTRANVAWIGAGPGVTVIKCTAELGSTGANFGNFILCPGKGGASACTVTTGPTAFKVTEVPSPIKVGDSLMVGATVMPAGLDNTARYAVAAIDYTTQKLTLTGATATTAGTAVILFQGDVVTYNNGTDTWTFTGSTPLTYANGSIVALDNKGTLPTGMQDNSKQVYFFKSLSASTFRLYYDQALTKAASGSDSGTGLFQIIPMIQHLRFADFSLTVSATVPSHTRCNMTGKDVYGIRYSNVRFDYGLGNQFRSLDGIYENCQFYMDASQASAATGASFQVAERQRLVNPIVEGGQTGIGFSSFNCVATNPTIRGCSDAAINCGATSTNNLCIGGFIENCCLVTATTEVHTGVANAITLYGTRIVQGPNSTGAIDGNVTWIKSAASGLVGTIQLSDGAGGLTSYFGATIDTGTGLATLPGGIKGTTTNDNATALSIGEVVTASRVSGSATSLTTATAKTITSISLTAGDWDVEGVVDYVPAAATTTAYVQQGASTTDNTLDAADTFTAASGGNLSGTVLGSLITENIPLRRLSLSTTTPVYLIGLASFAVSTMTAYGTIIARRMR